MSYEEFVLSYGSGKFIVQACSFSHENPSLSYGLVSFVVRGYIVCRTSLCFCQSRAVSCMPFSDLSFLLDQFPVIKNVCSLSFCAWIVFLVCLVKLSSVEIRLYNINTLRFSSARPQQVQDLNISKCIITLFDKLITQNIISHQDLSSSITKLKHLVRITLSHIIGYIIPIGLDFYQIIIIALQNRRLKNLQTFKHLTHLFASYRAITFTLTVDHLSKQLLDNRTPETETETFAIAENHSNMT